MQALGGGPWRVLVIGVAGLFGVLAVGCADGGSAGGGPASGTGSGTEAQSPEATTPEGDAVITFTVEGGFAAQLRSLQIDADGSSVAVVSGRRSTGRLPEAEVSAIVAELERSGLFTGDHTYDPPQGADLQRYEIGYAGATVVAYDTTVPAQLTDAVRLLQAALRSLQG